MKFGRVRRTPAIYPEIVCLAIHRPYVAFDGYVADRYWKVFSYFPYRQDPKRTYVHVRREK